LRAPGGRVPATHAARALPLRRRAPRGGTRERPRFAAPGGSRSPRALPLLRVRIARRAAARTVVARDRRGGCPAGAVLPRRRRARRARRGRARPGPSHAPALGGRLG